MRTHYAGHDAVYQRLRAAGQPGWATAPVLRENLRSLAAAMEAPHIPQCGRVLEVGCGAGDLSLWLAGRGYDVVGVDIAPAAIAWAAEKAREQGVAVELRVGDVTSLQGFGSEDFDFVLDGYCLHCLIGNDRGAHLASVFRVLKPGGIYHVRTMCGAPVTPACQVGYDPVSRCQLQGEIATRYYGRPEDIRNEVVQAGFTVAAYRVEKPPDPDAQTMLYLDAQKPARREPSP